MKVAIPGTVWQWQCDFCFHYYGPKTVAQGDLPGYDQMVADGWSVGKTFGDACPACLADGVIPKSERWATRTPETP